MNAFQKKCGCLYMLCLASFLFINIALLAIFGLYPIFLVSRAIDSFFANEGRFLIAVAITIMTTVAAWYCEKALAPYIGNTDCLREKRIRAAKYSAIPLLIFFAIGAMVQHG